MKYLIVFAAFFVSSGAMAQAYPNKPIRLVLPFGVGGLVDVPDVRRRCETVAEFDSGL